MEIKFRDEHFGMEDYTPGVYKVVFNEKWYYIGSSVDLGRRLSCWKHLLQKGITNNSSINFILPQVTDVRFQILQFCKPTLLLQKEKEHIAAKFEDDLCLNITCGRGKRKIPLGYIKPEPKPKPKKGEPTAKKPIACFDIEGHLLERYDSILATTKATGVKDTFIKAIANGNGGQAKGFVFRFIKADGSFHIPPPFESKNVSRHRRKFYQMDKDGNIIAEYYHKKQAAEALGIYSTQISRVLLGRHKYKTAKGYYFKYAE